ncbi:TetR family transcriptional regulator [Amycolatopsis rhizosphaerae]|uniref:TetR family transcriptional regulator n=1 Tax=Amycolatopsis rhizosphaerae TaxID=2053003 RepID=A0A558DH30_9PSEU|nr:TetR/AcrR family transcriptional regulator C-terminal domain-containing protein [Amycolatopsis rhizosphaerae]TVT60213.1 TetR family transcriptional regulator [Amycolatopsis rhizosphaerae]
MSRTGFERQSAAARAKGRQVLSRPEVLAAAARLLDESGIEGLSMRALARSLGTGPATLYWHVRDRDELLTAVLDETLSHIDVPMDGPWQDRLVLLAERMRTALLPRPALIEVLWHRDWQLGPVTLGLADATVGLVAESGLPDDDVADAYLAVLWFILGFVYAESQAAANTGFPPQAGTGDEPPRYPNLVRYSPDTDRAAMHRRFVAGLRQLLTGIEARTHQTDRKALS